MSKAVKVEFDTRALKAFKKIDKKMRKNWRVHNEYINALIKLLDLAPLNE